MGILSFYCVATAPVTLPRATANKTCNLRFKLLYKAELDITTNDTENESD